MRSQKVLLLICLLLVCVVTTSFESAPAVSPGCSFNKWFKEQIKIADQMAAKAQGNFHGLGISRPAGTWQEAESLAKMDAEASLAENIQVYVRTMSRLESEEVKSNSKSKTTEKLDEFILSISDVQVRDVKYIEVSRLECKGEFYMAMLAYKNRNDYFKDYVRLIPSSVTPMLEKLFKDTDKEFVKEMKLIPGK